MTDRAAIEYRAEHLDFIDIWILRNLPRGRRKQNLFLWLDRARFFAMHHSAHSTYNRVTDQAVTALIPAPLIPKALRVRSIGWPK